MSSLLNSEKKKQLLKKSLTFAFMYFDDDTLNKHALQVH